MTLTDRELMQQALEALGLVVWTNNPPVTDAIAALRERLAREEPTRAEKMREAGYTRRPSLREFPSDKPAREEQEPKCGAIIEVFGKDWRLDYMSLPVGKHKLYTQQYTYTAPQRREWVGLTGEEIGLLTTGDGWSHLETPALALFARAIEKLLKEKNQ